MYRCLCGTPNNTVGGLRLTRVNFLINYGWIGKLNTRTKHLEIGVAHVHPDRKPPELNEVKVELVPGGPVYCSGRSINREPPEL